MGTHVGTLRRVLVARLRSQADIFQTRLIVLALAVLSEKDHHSQSLKEG